MCEQLVEGCYLKTKRPEISRPFSLKSNVLTISVTIVFRVCSADENYVNQFVCQSVSDTKFLDKNRRE